MTLVEKIVANSMETASMIKKKMTIDVTVENIIFDQGSSSARMYLTRTEGNIKLCTICECLVHNMF